MQRNIGIHNCFTSLGQKYQLRGHKGIYGITHCLHTKFNCLYKKTLTCAFSKYF